MSTGSPDGGTGKVFSRVTELDIDEAFVMLGMRVRVYGHWTARDLGSVELRNLVVMLGLAAKDSY